MSVLTNGTTGTPTIRSRRRVALVYRSGEHERLRGAETAVRHEQGGAETRQPVAVTDLDADAVDDRVEQQILEMRIAAELVDGVAAVESPLQRVDDGVGREEPVGVDPVVRDGSARGNRRTHPSRSWP